MIQIILVDDEPLALEHLRYLIRKREEYQVIGAYTDPLQAMRDADNLRPDIIITDICMDGVSGLKMVEQMRQIWGKEFVFIVVSGYAEFQYVKKSMELGIRDYLLKPVTEAELFETLDKVKKEIKEKKYKREIQMLEKETEIPGNPSIEVSVILGELAEEILNLHVDRAEYLVKEMAGGNIEDSEKEMWERHLWILFRLLDEKLGHKNAELQVFWRRGWEKNSFSAESVEKCIRQSILKIIEEKEAYMEQSVLYMKLFIQDHYKEDISLQIFADKFSMNKAYLGQKFKKETGVSVNDYLQNRRIEEAVRLADTTAMSWQDIAAAVGYENYVSFLKYFVKWTGALPSDYICTHSMRLQRSFMLSRS